MRSSAQLLSSAVVAEMLSGQPFGDGSTALQSHCVSPTHTLHNPGLACNPHAGGLAIAAAVHMDPSVCAAALLDVPFLDVVGDQYYGRPSM
jgi:hypothetical protein